MRLYIVRHGESEGNALGNLQGHAPTSLTDNGRQQAEKLAKRLKDENIDVILSSDLPRAKETTDIIAKYHKVPVHYTIDLRERNYGLWEGKPGKAYHEMVKNSGIPKARFRPEQGQSYEDLKIIVEKTFNKILEDYKGKNVLISTHGGRYRVLLSVVLGIPLDEAAKLAIGNTALTVIEIGDESHKAHILNSTEHLSP
jgi:broad specificity phosphatase PhoE